MSSEDFKTVKEAIEEYMTKRPKKAEQEMRLKQLLQQGQLNWSETSETDKDSRKFLSRLFHGGSGKARYYSESFNELLKLLRQGYVTVEADQYQSLEAPEGFDVTKPFHYYERSDGDKYQFLQCLHRNGRNVWKIWTSWWGFNWLRQRGEMEPKILGTGTLYADNLKTWVYSGKQQPYEVYSSFNLGYKSFVVIPDSASCDTLYIFRPTETFREYAEEHNRLQSLRFMEFRNIYALNFARSIGKPQ